MATQQQQTAEKSVQTHEATGPTTVVLTNHPENTAAEVANTLVSMASGRQRATIAPTVKQLNVITVPNPSVTSSPLPILSLADYTTARGVPTASALANQAKLTPRKQDNILENNNNNSQDDDTSMSTDDYNQTRNDTTSTNKSRRGKKSKRNLTSKTKSTSSVDAIQYGPILVKPRKSVAPTLSSGRRSKDEPLPPDEDVKRQQRRDRNKQAAAKCRRKRNDLRETLENDERALVEQQQNLQHTVQALNEQKQHLEILLNRHACLRKPHLPITTTTNNVNLSKTDVKTLPTNNFLDPNNSKRVTINLTNAQDLFAVAPLTRSISTNDNSPSTSLSASSSTVPMITIHIIPEVAQALLGSTSVDKAKLAELLQQANTINLTTTSTPSINNNNNNNNDSTNSTN